ncbi:MAG TPA: flagellar biosynthesis anti-sigma factor FlgM [Rhodocyclaceae bacterium]
MKIEGLNTTSPLAGGSKPKASSAPRADAPASAGDSVAIGAAAALASGSEAPVDGARVQAIRQAISEGRFQINPEAIADRLIESARELIESQRRA